MADYGSIGYGSIDIRNAGPGGATSKNSGMFRDLSRYHPHHLTISRAQVFRSRLIEEFQLGEDQSSLDMQVPMISSEDFLDLKIRSKALRESPFQLIKFKPFKRTQNTDKEETRKDRRLTRTRNSKEIPIGVWAANLVCNIVYQRALLVLIVLNTISIAVEVELRPQVCLYLIE
jgi:hypothetical protein